MKILAVIGARPQFIKHAPFDHVSRAVVDIVTVHTGQHYDENMSKVFFEELGISEPTYMLNGGGGNHGQQTGQILMELEPIVQKEGPDYLLVYGDTNSTLAGALIASKLLIPIIHVESGLRSFNRAMPEEINRILTDHLSTILLTSTTNAIENLKEEGITKNVYLIGDIMVDSVNLAYKMNSSRRRPLDFEYYFATIHRPYNTDDIIRVKNILNQLNALDRKVVFPIHPRTLKFCEKYSINLDIFTNILFLNPLSYFDNIHYITHSNHVITDSGGMQKEAYILEVPCITIRSETEWTETLRNECNVLCFSDLEQLSPLIHRKIGAFEKKLYGDGNAASQILQILIEYNSK